MSEIVTIYTITCYSAENPEEEGTSCSLLPWDGRIPGRRGQDDGGREYVLPDGYSLGAEEEDLSPSILGQQGPCSLLLHDGRPLLIDEQKRQAFLLEPLKRIATYRAACGMTREELAQRLEVSQKELFEWENLEKQPEPSVLERIASVLGCKISDLT